MATAIVRLHSESADYETRIWLAAEAMYHRDHPTAGRLIYAEDVLRSRYVSTAVLAATAMNDRFGPSQARRLEQAAADYHCHRAHAMRASTLSCYHLTTEIEK